MSEERLKFKGRLLEKEQEAKVVRLKICGLRDAIRESLDPFDKVRNLPLAVVAEEAVEMADLQIKYVEILSEIEAIKRALGK